MSQATWSGDDRPLGCEGGHWTWHSGHSCPRRNEGLVRSPRPTSAPHLLELHAPGNIRAPRSARAQPIANSWQYFQWREPGRTKRSRTPMRNSRHQGKPWTPILSDPLTKTSEAGQQAPDPCPGHSRRKARVFTPFTVSTGSHVKWPLHGRACQGRHASLSHACARALQDARPLHKVSPNRAIRRSLLNIRSGRLLWFTS